MNKTTQAKHMDEQQIIFCKSQEEFAKTLKEVAAEENGFMEELGEE
ncbi:hypothetical protein M4S82_04120 [Planococcus sp. MERTA32b]|nr:hypothetical protein [Planococcus sp. MER TA 32b]